MTLTRKLLKPAFLCLSLSVLAACEHTSVGTATPQQNVARNTVQMVRLPLEINQEADGTDSLSRVTTGAISEFLRSVNAGYGDVIMLDAPSASAGRIAAVELMIQRTGLTYGGASALGIKPAEGAVMLYVERYVVTTPNCNYWPEVTSNQQRNNDSASLGCATTNNLGLMIANPRDLIAGHYSGTSTAAAVNALYGPVTTTGTVETPGSAGNAQSAIENLVGAVTGDGGNR